MIQRNRFVDAAAAAEACARHIVAQLATATAGGGTATLAVSGGTSPALMFRQMAKEAFDWTRVHLFWVDERAVPPTDDQSNYKLALDNFVVPAHFPHRNVHRVQTELKPEQAAARYTAEIREFFGIEQGDIPHFDVIHRGIGPDAHTASLFPGEPLISDREGISAAVWVEKMQSWRITLLPAVLLSARHTAVLATGKDKAQALCQVFGDPYDPMKYPAQLGVRDGRPMAWFMDDAALATAGS